MPLLKGGQEVGPWSFLQEKEIPRDGGHKVQQLAGFLLDFCAEIIILNNTPALRVCIFRSVT